jgi:hypothetical protein
VTKITVKCPSCSREITVKIATIDTLRKELARVTAERDELRRAYGMSDKSAVDALLGIFKR